MKRNNINFITNDGNVFRYVVGIEETKKTTSFFCENISEDMSIITNYELSHIKIVNDVVPLTINDKINCGSCILKVYFPEYKPELFVDDMNYLVEVFLNIEQHKVLLHSGIHTFLENVANETIFRQNETDYYEYFPILIPSPYEILFGDDFDGFRQAIGDIRENITSSVINIVITPLDDQKQIHSYVNFGTTCLQINNGDDNYLKPRLGTNVSEPFAQPLFQIDWKFNSLYEQTDEGMHQYFKETYFIEDYVIAYEFLVYDKETNVYKDFVEYDLSAGKHYELDYESCILGWEMLNFSLIARCNIQFIARDEYEKMLAENEQRALDGRPDYVPEFLLELSTQEYSITPEVYKYFAQQSVVNNIDFGKQKMNNYTFNIVNKVNKQVVQLERPTDYKANIIKPVFYKVRDLGMLNINPEVTENICLNLDAYKSKTKYFFIQIEGVIFNQIGSISAGIVFNIVGNKLPNRVGEGTYYILNSDKEMITSGKYKYN